MTEFMMSLAGIPWDDHLFRDTRRASLHLAVLYMSRVLIQVAELERCADTG